ncbi:8457_t:CDS:2 [Entrophospora sp. SA101]|nr:8457_t:CDS:2 [Entrophospora sp. SA101]
MLSRDFNNISSDKIMLMSNFSSIIRRSFQTSSVKNRFEPSKGKGVVGLYEFFQNGVDSPNPLPRTNELYPVELFQNKKFDIPSISITQPTIATPSSSISTNNSNQAVIGSAVNVEITPTSNGNENEMSEKELKTLQAQLSAYRVDKDLLQREIEKLQEKSLSAELQYKQIISTCCKIDLDKVDDFVETILGEVDNDLEDEFSLGRIGEILGKLDKEASQL